MMKGLCARFSLWTIGFTSVLFSISALGQSPQNCAGKKCLTGEGYAIEIIGYIDDRPPSPLDTPAARTSNDRVDIIGDFLVRLPGGGKLWATEDPAISDPRMAVHSDDVFTVENGRVAKPVEFFVYKNYDPFIERAVLEIFDGRDFDRLEPVASLPIPTGNFVRVLWDGSSKRALHTGDKLYYQARAFDQEGRVDRTLEKSMTAVVLNDMEHAPHSPIHSSMPRFDLEGDNAGPQLTSAASTPLDGAVVVMEPPLQAASSEALSYTLTPRFDTRKTKLKPPAITELDRIVDSWRGASNTRLVAIGHTDNIRIAPEHRNEFANNQVLSEARAQSIVNYLAERLGLSLQQIDARGYGLTQPVGSNDSVEGRAQNRRVEVHITGERVTTKLTRAPSVSLFDPASGNSIPVRGTLDDVVKTLPAKRTGFTAKSIGPVTDSDCAALQTYAHELQAVYGRNELVDQNITIYGSRVRLHGQDLAGNSAMSVNQHRAPIDTNGSFALDYMMPVGSHQMDVKFYNDACATSETATVSVNVSGKHMFIVALADVTLSSFDISGSLEPLSVDDRYDDDFLVEGRLAFYLKGKVKGKYLITAQLDTQEEELSDILENIDDKDPRSIFRRLDPDRYYPVYGDDSTTVADTDSIGKMYLRADWNNSHAMWGNFHTGFTGTELAQYNRSLYGAQLNWNSPKVNAQGASRTQANAFVSENQTELGHSEFIGTGGSLYYLKHSDILPGSEKLRIELRHRDSERVLENITLTRGVDYEVDEIQGRIILSRPLLQITQLQAPSLIRDGPLDGNLAVLVADYEYIPEGFDSNHIGYGFRGRQWFGEHLAVGGTYAQENRGGGAEDYQLVGGDVTLQMAPNTFINMEYVSSEESQAERFLSNNGGLLFSTIAGTTTAGREGDAFAVEARLNSTEVFDTENEWVVSSWYRHSDAGYSVARRDAGVDVDEYGGEIIGHIGDRWTWSGRASFVERENQREDKRYSLQTDYRLNDHSSLSAEVRHVDSQITGLVAGGLVNGVNRLQQGDGTLLGMRYTRQLTPRISTYVGGQVSVDQGDTYDNNDMGTLGVVAKISETTNLSAELNSGHRGDGSTVTLEHEINHRHRIYGTYTQSTDRTDTLANDQIAIGQRTVFSNRLSVFNEHQFAEYQDNESGVAHVFGLDFAPRKGWSIGATYQTGQLDDGFDFVDRDAVSGSLGYQGKRMRLSTRLELRRDEGINTDSEQWVSSSRADYKFSDSTRFLGRLNFSETEDLVNPDFDAEFTEAQVGVAYRPVEHGRFNLLAKYTYLYDLRGFDQIQTGTDQRSNVFSVEGIYRLNPRWDLGGKYVYRSGELRTGRNTGDWFESTANFFAVRGRYHLIRRWDAIAEYRWLEIEEAGSTREGALLGVDRHFGDHMKLGIGYNFTDFSDDLTDLDYDNDGWFLNALGKY